MEALETLITIVHLFTCFFLILVVLLQSGKGGGMGAAFGGGGSQTAFGARGSATVLTKATTILGALFLIGAFVLGILGERGTPSLISGVEAPVSAPAEPATPAPSPDDPQ